MTEQDLLDIFIQERIDMLLNNRSKTMPRKSREENERIVRAEKIISNLPDKDRELIQNYIDNFTDLFASSEPFLYQHGFLDRIRTLKFINNF